MLAMSDKSGCVYASIPGLAHIANVGLHETELALSTLLSPDKYSRTPEKEGRRIEPIDGGWRLLNHAKFRAVRSAEERREYMREYMRDKREKEKLLADSLAALAKSTDVTPPAPSPLQKKDQKKKKPSPSATALPDPPEFIDPEAWAGFVAMRSRIRHPLTARAAKLIHAELSRFKMAGHDPNQILDKSTRNGWRDVYSPERQSNANGAQGKLSATERVAANCAAAEAAEREWFDGDFTAAAR